MAALFALIASSSNESTGNWGFLIIAAVIVAIVLVIGAVWTFTARRASRVPRRARHEHEPGAH
jgi:threonine/homoserine/homoserine lactone efflux protein